MKKQGAKKKPNFQSIMLNRIRLDSCNQHLFEDEQPVAIQSLMTCTRCKGKFPLLQIDQYMRGFVAAGGNPVEVWAGWNDTNKEITCRCPKCLLEGINEDCNLCKGLNTVFVSNARSYLKELNNKIN